MTIRHLAIASVTATCIALGACSQQDQGEQPVAAVSDDTNSTVAATVAALPDHRKLATALSDTQLAPVLDGKGIYTLLAPGDDAFAALGAKGEALTGKERRPLMIAVLRAHLLPGEVTPASIADAVARKQGPVTMRTMAGGTVRFEKAEAGLTVSNGTAKAALVGVAHTTSNGAVLPIDTVLLPAG